MGLALFHLHLTSSLHIFSPLPLPESGLKKLPFLPPEILSFKLAMESGAGASGLKSPPTANVGKVFNLSVPTFLIAKYDSSNHLTPMVVGKIKFNFVACFITTPGVNVSSHTTFSFLHLSLLLSPNFLPLTCKQAHLAPPFSYCPFIF